MKSLFKEEKKDLALDWITERIINGAQNSATAVIRIHTICQNPENYSNPGKLINQWIFHLFSANLHSNIDDWGESNFVTPKKRASLEYTFFHFYASHMPILFLGKKFKISNFKSYKWTKKDFEALKFNLIEGWFSEEFNTFEINNHKPDKSFENKVGAVINYIDAVKRAKHSLFKNEARLDFLLNTGKIKYTIKETLPELNTWFKNDIFHLYSDYFVDRLNGSLEKLESDFYEKGNCLHKFFQWN